MATPKTYHFRRPDGKVVSVGARTRAEAERIARGMGVVMPAKVEKPVPKPAPAKKTARQVMEEAQKAIEAGKKHIAMGQAEITRRRAAAAKAKADAAAKARTEKATPVKDVTPEATPSAGREYPHDFIGPLRPGSVRLPPPKVDPVVDPVVDPATDPMVDPEVTPAIEPEVKPDIDPKQEAIDLVQQQLEEFEKMQEADLKKDDDVPVRPRVYLDKIKEMLEKPEEVERPDLATEFEALRARYQVDPLESQLSSVNRQITDLMTLADKALRDEEKAMAPTAVIRLKQQRMGAEFNQKLTAFNLQRKTIIDELNSKYDTINNIMQLKKKDYRMARDDYEREFNRQLTLYRLLTDEKEWQYKQDIRQIEREDQAAERTRRTALANWQVTSDIIQENLRLGILPSFAELPEEVKISLRELELQAGLPAGFTENTIGLTREVDPERRVIHRAVWPDKSKVTVMYDDGTSRIIDTGIPPEAVPLVDLTPTQKRWAEAMGIDWTTPEGRRQVLDEFHPSPEEDLTFEERKAKQLKQLEKIFNEYQERGLSREEALNQEIMDTAQDIGFTPTQARNVKLEDLPSDIVEIIKEAINKVYGEEPGWWERQWGRVKGVADWIWPFN